MKIVVEVPVFGRSPSEVVVDSFGVTVVSVVAPSVVLVSVVVDEVQGGDINDGVKEITLIGEVDEAGFALLKEQLVVEKSKKTEQEKLEKQQREEERKATEVYKTYQGKDYTYNEWVVKEQELWEEYQRTKKRK